MKKSKIWVKSLDGLDEDDLRGKLDVQENIIKLKDTHLLYCNFLHQKIQEYYEGDTTRLLKLLGLQDELLEQQFKIKEVLGLCSYEETRIKRREYINNFEQLAPDVIKLHQDLETEIDEAEVTNIKDKALKEFINASKETELANIQTKYSNQLHKLEKEAIQKAGDQDKDNLNKVLYKFQGKSVYLAQANIKEVIPKDELESINKAVDLVSKRSLRLLEIGYSQEGNSLIELVPKTFVPKEFIQEKRIFDAIDDSLTTIKQDEAYLSEIEAAMLDHVNNNLDASGKIFEQIKPSYGTQSGMDGSLSSMEDIMKLNGEGKGLESLKEYHNFSQAFKDFKGGDDKKTVDDFLKSDEFKSNDALNTDNADKYKNIYTKTNGDNDILKWSKAIAATGKIGVEAVLLAMDAIKFCKGKKDDKAIIAFSSNVISKITDWGASAMGGYGIESTTTVNIDGLEVDTLNIVQATLKSVSVLTKFLSGETTALKNQVNTLEFWDDTITNMLDLGAGVGEVINIFLPIGGLISSSVTFLKDLKELIKLIKECNQKVHMVKRAKLLKKKAEMNRSNFLQATKAIKKQAKKESVSAHVNVIGKSIQVLGDGTTVVGSAMTLSPIAPIGITVNVAGKITKALGGLIVLTKEGIMEAINFVGYHHTKKYIKLVRKGNLEALDHILSHSVTHAKAFLIYGAIDKHEIVIKDGEEIAKLNPDPVVDYYCNSLGIDIDNIDEAMATRIIFDHIQGEDSKISLFTNRFKNYRESHTPWDKSILEGFENNNALTEQMDAELKIYFECKSFRDNHIMQTHKPQVVENQKKANLKKAYTFLEDRISELNREIHQLQKTLSNTSDLNEIQKNSTQLKNLVDKRLVFKGFKNNLPEEILS